MITENSSADFDHKNDDTLEVVASTPLNENQAESHKKKQVTFEEQTLVNNVSCKTRNNGSSAQNATMRQERSRAALKRFLDHGPYDYTDFKPNKLELFKSAFTHQLNLIYDNEASKIDKLREILISPQLNVFIIILIVVDWIFAVAELFTDFLYEKSEFLATFDTTVTYFSLTVLGLFLLEVILKLVLVPKYFFGSKLELFDALVVTISFVFEIIFAVKIKDYEGNGSVLIIFRFWRILRIISRIVFAVERQFFEDLSCLREKILDILEENERLRADLSMSVLKNLQRPLKSY